MACILPKLLFSQTWTLAFSVYLSRLAIFLHATPCVHSKQRQLIAAVINALQLWVSSSSWRHLVLLLLSVLFLLFARLIQELIYLHGFIPCLHNYVLEVLPVENLSLSKNVFCCWSKTHFYFLLTFLKSLLCGLEFSMLASLLLCLCMLFLCIRKVTGRSFGCF